MKKHEEDMSVYKVESNLSRCSALFLKTFDINGCLEGMIRKMVGYWKDRK